MASVARKDAAFSMNVVAGPDAATTNPPTAGPTARAAGRSLALTTQAPGLMMPAFSAAISSMEWPRKFS